MAHTGRRKSQLQRPSPNLLHNLSVNSNTVTQVTGTAAGVGTEGSEVSNSVYTDMNNTFQSNNFSLDTPSGDYFYWMGESMPLASFLAYF